MRSKIKGIVFRVACFSILILGVCAFGFYKSFAASAPFAIDGVEVTQKSDTATGDVAGVAGNRINNNVTFHKVGDSVTYKIKIKNVSGGDRIIENVNSNYQGELFAYEFNSYAGDTIAADETFDFVIKTTYANAVSDVTKRQQNLEIKFVFKFSDGSEMTIVVANPSTWDNISVFGVIFASCIIGLLAVVVFRCRKMAASKKVVISGILLAVACVPFPFVNAADGTYDVAIANNYTLNDELLVRFVDKDGSEEIATETISYDDVATSVAAPDVEGYYFDGWKTETGEDYNFSMPVTEDLTLHASYMPYTYVVKFNGDKATSGEMSNQTLTYDTAANLSKNNFKRAGYNFAGWSTTEEGTSDLIPDEGEVLNLRNTSGVFDLYAIWTARNDTKYTVTSKIEQLEGEGEYVTIPIEHTGTTDQPVTPAPASIDGYGTPEAQTETIKGDGSTNIIYVYNLLRHQLTLEDASYIETTATSGEYKHGATVTLKAKEREGWTFEKWSDGQTDKEITITINDDVTISPVYKKEKFVTVFKHDGACTFNGKASEGNSGSGNEGYLQADNITGENCADYADKTYIDTGVKLFSEDNAHKDFLLEFSIDEFDLSKNGNRATFMNATYEKPSVNFPGIVFRRDDNRDRLMVGVNIVENKVKLVNAKKYYAPASSVQKVVFMRKNDAICYAINDGPSIYVGDNTRFNQYFESPAVMFGVSIDNDKGDKEQRHLNGTLSGMKIMLGEDENNIVDCQKP